MEPLAKTGTGRTRKAYYRGTNRGRENSKNSKKTTPTGFEPVAYGLGNRGPVKPGGNIRNQTENGEKLGVDTEKNHQKTRVFKAGVSFLWWYFFKGVWCRLGGNPRRLEHGGQPSEHSRDRCAVARTADSTRRFNRRGRRVEVPNLDRTSARRTEGRRAFGSDRDSVARSSFRGRDLGADRPSYLSSFGFVDEVRRARGVDQDHPLYALRATSAGCRRESGTARARSALTVGGRSAHVLARNPDQSSGSLWSRMPRRSENWRDRGAQLGGHGLDSATARRTLDRSSARLANARTQTNENENTEDRSGAFEARRTSLGMAVSLREDGSSDAESRFSDGRRRNGATSGRRDSRTLDGSQCEKSSRSRLREARDLSTDSSQHADDVRLSRSKCSGREPERSNRENHPHQKTGRDRSLYGLDVLGSVSSGVRDRTSTSEGLKLSNLGGKNGSI